MLYLQCNVRGAVKDFNVIYLWLVACMAFMMSCSSGSTLAKIKSAGEIVESDSHRALEIVEGVDPLKLRSEHDRALYALVYSEACYYGFVDVESDTLTRPMMRYYLDSENHMERARAMYQHAAVAQRCGEFAEAMVALMEAEVSLMRVPNTKLMGLVQRLKGDIYSDGCLYANALDAYSSARGCFEELQLNEHVLYLDYDIGGTLVQLRRFEDACVKLEDVLRRAYEVDDRALVCGVLHELLDLSIYMDDYTMCADYVSEIEDDGLLYYGMSHHMCVKAMLISRSGRLDEALAMIDRAELEDDMEWADVEYARYIVYRNCGCDDKALYWQEQSKNVQDRLMLEVLEQPVLNLQVDMLRSSLDAEMRERVLMRQRNMTIYVALAIAFILVVVAVILYVCHRERRKDREIASYIETIESLKVDLERVPRDMAASISFLYRDRFSELNELCDIYYDHSGSARHKNMVFNKVADTIAAIKGNASRIDELEVAVDSYRDRAMQRLKSAVPRLSERDRRVALYSFAGFSNRAIALFIDSDPVAVSKIKYNIKQKIKSADVADGDNIAALLSDK